MANTPVFNLRLPANEKLEIDRLAMQRNLSTSEFTRRMIRTQLLSEIEPLVRGLVMRWNNVLGRRRIMCEGRAKEVYASVTDRPWVDIVRLSELTDDELEIEVDERIAAMGEPLEV